MASVATGDNSNYSGYNPGDMGRRFYKAKSLNDLSAVSDDLLELSAKDRMKAKYVVRCTGQREISLLSATT